MLGAVLNYLLHFRCQITNRTVCVVVFVAVVVVLPTPQAPQTPQLHLY